MQQRFSLHSSRTVVARAAEQEVRTPKRMAKERLLVVNIHGTVTLKPTKHTREVRMYENTPL